MEYIIALLITLLALALGYTFVYRGQLTATQTEAALADKIHQAGGEFLLTSSGEEVGRGNRSREGNAGEAVMSFRTWSSLRGRGVGRCA